jgi:hypothetical protein
MKRALNFMNKGSLLDADAQAFISAAGLTDPTQISAINTLVVSLKGYSLWTKFKAIYPIVGGTAFTHKWNLKDPRDLNAAFRVTFYSTITHDSNGIQGVSSAYGVTYIDPTINLNVDNSHLSAYSRTDSNGFYADLGSYAGDKYFTIWGRVSNSFMADIPGGGANRFYGSNTSSLGLLTGSRISNTSASSYRNAATLATSTATRTVVTEANDIYLMTTGGSGYYSNRQYAWFSIGDGLTNTDVSNLYTAVQAYQTTLGRQV